MEIKINSANRLQKQTLEKRLADLEENYQGLERDYQGAGDTDEKNRLQSKLDRTIEEIEKITQKINKLNNLPIRKLIDILKNYFIEQKHNILRVYYLSLPNRLIDKGKEPQDATELINNLQIPQQQGIYSCIEKFVAYFFILEQTIDLLLKQKLKKWAEENINNCLQLIKELSQELDQPPQKASPVLLLAIVEQQGGYFVEAWLLKNLVEDKQYSSSDFEPLSINSQVAIRTDENLSNVPELIDNFIAQSFNKCQTYLKQIQIFLPAKLMNHTVDYWKNWQGDEKDDDDEYATTIGDEYEILLRCSERLKGNSPAVVKWRDKASILKSNLAESAEEMFILGNSDSSRSLFKELKSSDELLAVKITTVFQQKEPGTLLWKAGVPIALWVRQQLPKVENKLVLDGILNDCCLKIIPEKVKRERLKAFDYEPPESHIGRHLCLLWDDPNLLPPTQNLTQNKL